MNSMQGTGGSGCGAGASVYVADALHSVCAAGIMSGREVMFTGRSVESCKGKRKEVEKVSNCEACAADAQGQ